MSGWAPGGALASNVEVTAATVQRGDIIQLGGQACRVSDLFQLARQATPLRVGRAADHARANPARCRPHAEKAVIRPVSSRHHDIADDLRYQITTGHIKPGTRLPSEAGLADRYKVSTVTLRSALAVLQGEGLVEKIHGKGNFARRPPRKIVYVGGWERWTRGRR